MIIDKEEIRKSIFVDPETDEVMESYELKVKIVSRAEGDHTIEDAMNMMHRVVDTHMAKLLKTEAAVAPMRTAEAERWTQMGLFPPSVGGSDFSITDLGKTSGDAPED